MMLWKHRSFKSLFFLNLAHMAIGLIQFVLSLVQFSSVTLDNASLIDFRSLNIIHILTGAIGLHMIRKNFGYVVPKTLYFISFVLSLWTMCFYCDTLSQECSQFESIKEMRRLDGGEELVTNEIFKNHTAKLAICSVIILLSIAEVAVCLGCFIILRKLKKRNYNQDPSPILVSNENIRQKQQMAFVALMKIACSLAVIGLGAYLEVLYKKKTTFIKIGWHILNGAIIFIGACIDLRALYGGQFCDLLNLKVSLIFSVTSSVLSLKTLDYAVTNYFVTDVREYTRYDELREQLQIASSIIQIKSDIDKRELLVKFIVHSGLLACLVLSFAHCVISAIIVGSFIEKYGNRKKVGSASTKISTFDSRTLGSSGIVPANNFRYFGASRLANINDDMEWDQFSLLEYDDHLHKRKTYSGIVQCLCGLASMGLCVVSLVWWDFSWGYEGGVGVLWLACLFIASGLINANRPKTFTTSVYVLSLVSSALAFERAVYSLNVVYQAANNDRFKEELVSSTNPVQSQSNSNTHTGRITFYSLESAIMLLQFLFSSWTCLQFTRAIHHLPPSFCTASHTTTAKSKGALCSLGLFHLLYAFLTISCSIASEVALWAYNVHVSSLIYTSNGIVVFSAVFVQWLASQRPQFLLPASIMNTITASISFFLVAPAMRDLYTLVAGYRTMVQLNSQKLIPSEMFEMELKAKPIQEWIIGMNSLIVLFSIIEFVISVISGMICSYLLHHAYQSRNTHTLSVDTTPFPTLPRINPNATNTNTIYYGGSIWNQDRSIGEAPWRQLEDAPRSQRILNRVYCSGQGVQSYPHCCALPSGHGGGGGGSSSSGLRRYSYIP